MWVEKGFWGAASQMFTARLWPVATTSRRLQSKVINLKWKYGRCVGQNDIYCVDSVQWWTATSESDYFIIALVGKESLWGFWSYLWSLWILSNDFTDLENIGMYWLIFGLPSLWLQWEAIEAQAGATGLSIFLKTTAGPWWGSEMFNPLSLLKYNSRHSEQSTQCIWN